MFNLFTNSVTNTDNKLKHSQIHRKQSSKLSISPQNTVKEDFHIEEILTTVFNKHY